jgi:hypothetical protein
MLLFNLKLHYTVIKIMFTGNCLLKPTLLLRFCQFIFFQVVLVFLVFGTKFLYARTTNRKVDRKPVHFIIMYLTKER